MLQQCVQVRTVFLSVATVPTVIIMIAASRFPSFSSGCQQPIVNMTRNAAAAGATLYECVAGEKLPRSVLAEAVGRLDASLQLRQLMAALLHPDAAARPSAQVHS